MWGGKQTTERGQKTKLKGLASVAVCGLLCHIINPFYLVSVFVVMPLSHQTGRRSGIHDYVCDRPSSKVIYMVSWHQWY